MPDVTYTAWFDEISADDVALAGGKGANLGELSRAGLPVPPGFVVTTAAYDAFVEAGGLEEEILRLASRAEDTAALQTAAEEIRALFARAEIPEDVAREIRAAYQELGEGGESPVAVRSSATAEDLPGASFAGQQETFLNVRGEEALMERIKNCWASLWTARAMAYRGRRGTAPQTVSLAVVVQRMVEAEAAGTLFTADPVGGRRDRVVIDAAWGLGEAVVGGLVTPDTLVVEKTSGRVISRRTADKEVMTVYAGEGTEERSVPEAQRREEVLDDEAAVELARYGARIEDLYGAPQDVEWALAGGRFFIVQARPITNLPPLEEVRWEPPVPGSAWWRRQVVENMPEPLSPLFDELYLREGLELSIEALMAALGMTYVRVEDFIDRPLFTTVNGYAYLRADYKLGWRTVPLMVRATLDEFRKLFGDETAGYWRDRALPSYLARIERWKATSPADASDEQLLAGVRELALEDARYWFACAFMIARAKVTDALLNRFLGLLTPGRGLTSGIFLRGFPSPTVDAETELEALAERVRGSDELRSLVSATPAASLPEALEDTTDGRAWLADLARYLERYGHQIYNLDFVAPTQADDPLPVLLSLKAMAQRSGHDPRSRQRHPLARGLLAHGAGHGPGVLDHDPRVDPALLPGARPGDRRRRHPGPRFDRGSRVRHPGRPRHRHRDHAHNIRPDHPGRRRPGHRHAPRREGRNKPLPAPTGAQKPLPPEKDGRTHRPGRSDRGSLAQKPKIEHPHHAQLAKTEMLTRRRRRSRPRADKRGP
jgi:hypothetical protein